MLKVKPYICTTHYPFSISDHPLSFPISILNPISLRLSQSHPTPTIPCAKRRGWSQPSNRKILQLASTVAFNLKILPEPFNSLAGEIARGDSQTLSFLVGGGRRGKIAPNRRVAKKKSAWFAFVLVCVAGGLWSWRIQEFDLFLRALSFCLAGISLLRLWLGKKAVREWVLGFFFGVVLILSSRLGKEDLKFWVHKLASSPVTQIVTTIKRSRNRNTTIRTESAAKVGLRVTQSSPLLPIYYGTMAWSGVEID
ncbi:hypothetical protein GmHk_10G029366 [Glycine max]|nr:hypothetical protein GmHk_10G029366 [Glycine max]